MYFNSRINEDHWCIFSHLIQFSLESLSVYRLHKVLFLLCQVEEKKSNKLYVPLLLIDYSSQEDPQQCIEEDYMHLILTKIPYLSSMVFIACNQNQRTYATTFNIFFLKRKKTRCTRVAW